MNTKSIFCILLAFLFLIVVPKGNAKAESINDDIFRLHIIANSDSAEDQSLKMFVRDNVLEFESELFRGKSVTNAETAKALIMDNASALLTKIEDALHDKNVDCNVEMRVGVYEFPDRTYNDVTYPEGLYNALRIVLGEGKGKNWWCVMFPPLCIMETDSGQSDTVQVPDKKHFKSLLEELFNKVLELFS